jgi:hypothetical protein
LSDIKRRAFIASIVTGAIPLVAPIPKWLGEPAGGFYAPVPDDISEYVKWMDPVSPANQFGAFQKGLLMFLWAPLGSTVATYQYVAVDYPIFPTEERNRRLLKQKQTNALNTIRELLVQSHDPGWTRIHETYETVEPQGYDEDGDPYYYASRNVWRRTGYLRWMKPSEITSAVVHV